MTLEEAAELLAAAGGPPGWRRGFWEQDHMDSARCDTQTHTPARKSALSLLVVLSSLCVLVLLL